MNTQLLFRPPQNQREVDTFQDICQLVGLPRSQGVIDNNRYKGLLVVVPEGTIVGGISYSLYSSGSIVSIDALAIKPDHQHHGIGRDIIGFLTNSLKENGVRKVEVAPTGESLDFYLKCGFVPANDVGFEYSKQVA